jgi:hypothetical protein
MALNNYITLAQRLLNDPNAQFYAVTDLTSYINIGRGQLAAISGCLAFRVPVSVSFGSGAMAYSAIASQNAPTGCNLPVNIRSVSVQNSDGSRSRLTQRPWPYFDSYYLSGPQSTASGKPAVWSVLLEGTLGTLYFSPQTDGNYMMTVESTWEPIALQTDDDPEALPYPWTDAIPYYAAYYAYYNAQRMDDAERMLGPFEQITGISRAAVTPRLLPDFSAQPKPLEMGGSRPTGGAAAGGAG